MSTITKEWLQQKIADMEAARDEIPFGLDEDDSNTLAAMKLALASLEAEAAITVGDDGGDALAYRRLIQTFAPGTKLYTAPPAPVSVPECFESLLHHAYGMTMGHDWNKGTMAGHHRTKLCQAVEECRAAMLQGAENAGSPTTMKTVPALDSSPKIAESTSGNSPVIPNGWALVPVEPTEDMIVNGFESEPDESFSDEKEWEAYNAMSGCQQAAHRARLCWAAMIAAAPKLKHDLT